MLLLMLVKASLSPGDKPWSEFPAFELWWSPKIRRYGDVLFALMVEKCRICFSLGKCLGFAVISSVFSTRWWNRDILAVKRSWHEVIGYAASSSPLISEASRARFSGTNVPFLNFTGRNCSSAGATASTGHGRGRDLCVNQFLSWFFA